MAASNIAYPITFPEIDVLFEGEEKTHRAKCIKDKPSIKAALYEAGDIDTRFYIDYEYLSECSKNHVPAKIPMLVIEKQKKWEAEKAAFEQAWFRSKDVSKPDLIVRPDAPKLGSGKLIQ